MPGLGVPGPHRETRRRGLKPHTKLDSGQRRPLPGIWPAVKAAARAGGVRGDIWGSFLGTLRETRYRCLGRVSFPGEKPSGPQALSMGMASGKVGVKILSQFLHRLSSCHLEGWRECTAGHSSLLSPLRAHTHTHTLRESLLTFLECSQAGHNLSLQPSVAGLAHVRMWPAGRPGAESGRPVGQSAGGEGRRHRCRTPEAQPQ